MCREDDDLRALALLLRADMAQVNAQPGQYPYRHIDALALVRDHFIA